MTHPDNQSSRTDRLNEVLAAYLRSVESGQPPNVDHLLREHPDLADELKSFFANRAALERVAAPLKGAALEPTIDVTSNFSSSSAPQASPLPLGKVRYFGDYELLEEIARGGMGVVFRARQVSLNRIVAVKMILAGQLADEAAVRRFRTEAEAAARLDHPNIVPVFEVGEHGEQHYFSMGFVDGQSLAARLTSGPLSPREAAALIEQVARAVQFAHEHGVIHRDLKPANILLDATGRPKVTDFGLAKVVTRDQGLTETGQVLGTPGYMPPEQFDGKHVGPQADVYGLGAILYALLTGRPPFQAATLMETLQQVLEVEPASVRQLNPSVPRDLETIVKKCLEKWPDWRYQSAADLADELRRFLDGEPIHARRTSLIENGVRWFRKQSRSVALALGTVAATLVLAALGAVGWFGYQDWRLGRVTLKSDRPPIVAELLDDHDELVTPTFTVPTQEPIAAPADEYRAQLSQPLRFSRSHLLSIDRNTTRQFAVNLEDQLVRTAKGETSLHVEQSYALVTRRGRADVLLLDKLGIRRPGWPEGGATWSLPLNKPADDPKLKAAPGLRWPWDSNVYFVDAAHSIMHPQVLRHSPDIDGDGNEDVIVAARHQAWLLAVSGKTGKILWFASRGSDMQHANANLLPPQSRRNPSAVLGEPLLIGDQDGDGLPDLMATFVDTGTPPKPEPDRWLECLSSKSGQTIWRFDLDATWFQLTDGVETPEEARGLISLDSRTSGSGSHSTTLRRIRVERVHGQWHPISYPPLLIEDGARKLALVVAGTRAIGVDVATGKQACEPLELGLPPVRPPQLAELNGAGMPELVVVQLAKSTLPGIADFESSITAWDVSQMLRPREDNSDQRPQPIWRHKIAAHFRRGLEMNSSLADWPLLADLDNDGRQEVIVPSRTPEPTGVTKPWAEIEVLDGTNGNLRWRRRLKTVDLQFDRMVAGPDINGDGQRELFTAAFVGERNDLFVDALSGRDGKSLWWTSRRLGQPAWIERMLWWEAGDDGWPRLLVQTVPEYRNQQAPRLLSFSAGTGQFAGEATDFDEVRFADADGDGLSELFGLQYAVANFPNRGGRLQALRGVVNERWRRLGGAWKTGADYDGDGQTDLVAAFPAGTPTLAAISGRDGRSLWRRTHDFDPRLWNPNLQPLDVDLDRDGTSDLIAHAGTQSGGAMAPRTQFPVAAISGRTGAKLWSVEMTFGALESVLFVEGRDLDSDGSPEVIFSTFTDWDYPRKPITVSSAFAQHWLAVVEGRTGKFRWRQPLSIQYGLSGAPNRTDQTSDADFRPSFADLDRDGVTDVVMVAEISDSPGQMEWRACDGRDGKRLWGRPFPSNAGVQYVWQSSVPPVVSDWDADGQLELVGLEHVVLQSNTATQQSRLQLFALDAATGRELWTWQSRRSTQQIGAAPAVPTARSRPLLLARRKNPPLFALGERGWFDHVLRAQQPSAITLLDHTGREVGKTLLKSDQPFSHWATDLDDDGQVDLLVLDAKRLLAIKVAPSSDASTVECQTLWEMPLAINGHSQLVSLLTPTASDPPSVVLQTDTMLQGLSGKTGKPLWTNPDPQPLGADGTQLRTSVQLLGGAEADAIPAAVFQWGEQLSARCEARRVSAHAHVAAAPIPLASASALRVDPRLQVRPPWAYEDVDRVRGVLRVFWAVVLATCVVLIPGRTLMSMIIERRWSLKSFLLLPLFVGWALILLRVPAPISFEPQVLERVRYRLEMAFAFLSLPIFAALLIDHLWHFRWRRVLVWIAAIFVSAALYVTLSLHLESRRLSLGESFVLRDLDIPLAYGCFFVAWLATAVVWGSDLVRWLRGLHANQK